MQTPPIVAKPPLARWLFERDMSIRQGANFFETTPETMRRAVLPYTDPLARVPYPGLMRRIIERTAGEVRPDGWYLAAHHAAE